MIWWNTLASLRLLQINKNTFEKNAIWWNTLASLRLLQINKNTFEKNAKRVC